MSKHSEEVVTLGADTGGRDAYVATNEHVLALRRALAAACKGPYGKTVREIALVLRIDGSVQAWMRSGVDGLALKAAGTYATADIYVPRDAWAHQNVVSLRSFLAAEVTAAVSEIVGYITNKGIHIAGDELKSDVSSALMKFTAASTPDA